MSILGKSKILKKILKNSDLKKEEAIYIGDETRDVEAAKKAGIRSGVVSWGYSHPDKLISMKPDYVFKTFSDIIDMNS